jgi:hypothetical protein
MELKVQDPYFIRQLSFVTSYRKSTLCEGSQLCGLCQHEKQTNSKFQLIVVR